MFSQFTLNLYIGCGCSDFVSEAGYGRCLKEFGNKPICYVDLPSDCNDLKKSSIGGKKFSAQACTEGGPTEGTQCQIQRHIIFFYTYAT